MSDPISIVTSVVALIEMTEYLAKTCKHYISRVRKAQEDIERLSQEVKSLGGVLESLKGLVEGPNGQKLSITRTLLSDLESCSSTLKSLAARLRPDDSKKPMRRWGWRALKWPLNSSEVEKSIGDLEKFKTTFSLALSADQINYTVNIDQKITLTQLQVAKGATFDAYDNKHDECLRGTRVELLEKLEEWAKSPGGKCIFWLNGRAGTGKSTISRTMASRLQGAKMLGASFFFRRGEEGLQNAQKLFPTLVQQLANKIPQLVPGVQKAIEEDTNITEKALREQFDKLLFEPMQEIKQIQPTSLVVVIDALDECEREEDIRLLLRLLPQLQNVTAVRLKFLMTGRPELPIRLGFMEVGSGYQDMVLHDIAEEVIERDIALFLDHRLGQIRKEWSYRRVALSPEWPGEHNLTALVKMSVPLFIFAATICRMLQDDQWHPEDSLKDILSHQSHGSQLDQTYLPVLNRLPISQSNKRARQLTEEYRTLLGTVLVLQTPLSINPLSELTGIPKTSIHQRLNSLHSVLSVPELEKEPVRLFHLSFRDFLLDEDTRDKTALWIDEEQANRHITTQCLAIMRLSLKKNICQLSSYGVLRSEIDDEIIQRCISPELHYSCRYWSFHYLQSRNLEDGEICEFLKVHFLNWIEVMSLLGDAARTVEIIADLQSAQDNQHSELSQLLYDARRFMLRNRYISETAPLQTYSSGLPFAPRTSIVRNIFKGDIPKWICGQPEVDDGWSALMQTLHGHQDGVNSVAFSPNGQILASGSSDGTIKLWNPTTGELRQTLIGHEASVSSVTLSPRLLASSSREAIKIWDPFTGELKHVFQSYTWWPVHPVLSPYGLLAFGASDNTIQLWDSTTRQLKPNLAGHEDKLLAMAFSSELLASSSQDMTVKLWEPVTGRLQRTLEVHTEASHLAFSPEGLLATGGPDGIVKVWNSRTGELQQTLYNEVPTGPIVSLSIAPNELTLASIAMDATIRIWNLPTGKLENTLFGGDGQFLPSIAFSPTSQAIASASLDSNIRLWDPITQGPQAVGGLRLSIFSMAFSQDCQLLATGSSNGIVQVWDASTGKPIWSSFSHPNSEAIVELTFSPNGQVLASGSGDSSITLWSAATGGQEKKLLGHDNHITRMEFSPDSGFLASMSLDKTVRLWDLTADDPHGDSILLEENVTVGCFAFSPDSTWIAVGSRTLHMWSITTGRLEHTLEGHTTEIIALAFAPEPNCQLLASGSDDEIKLWNAINGQLYHVFSVSKRSALGLMFSRNGPFLNTARERFSIGEWYHKETTPGDDEEIERIASRNPEDLLGREDRWICIQGKRMLYLPIEYQSFTFALAENIVALGFDSEVLFVSLT